MRFVANRPGHAGFTLVEILIYLGVFGILSMAFVSVVMVQVNATVGQQLKMNLLSLQGEVSVSMNDPALAAVNLDPIRVDTTRISSPAYAVSLDSITLKSHPGAPAKLAVGQKIPLMKSSFTVEKISMTNIREVGPDRYKYDLQISGATPTSDHGQMRVLNLHLCTDPATPVGSKAATKCASPTALRASCRTVDSGAPVGGVAKLECGSGEALRAGGGECLLPSGKDKDPQSHMIMNRMLAPDEWVVECEPNYESKDGKGMARAQALCCKS